MTNIELKAQIDVDITNKTTAKSVTPTNVGTDIKSVVDYVDQEIIANLGVSVLEYVAQLYQAGTAAPEPQSPQINTLEVGSLFSGDNYREVVFNRIDVGMFRIKVQWKNIDTDPNKLALFFGDAVARIVSSSNGGGGVGSANYKEWHFNTYNISGILSDDVLLGNNGTFFSVKLYK